MPPPGSSSLADRILRHHDPTARRTAPPPRAPAEPAGGPQIGLVRREVEGIRDLLGEVSREWSDLQAEVAELKRTLDPDDLEEVFAASGLSTLLENGVRSAAHADLSRAPPGSPEAQARILEILGLVRERLAEGAAPRPQGARAERRGVT